MTRYKRRNPIVAVQYVGQPLDELVKPFEEFEPDIRDFSHYKDGEYSATIDKTDWLVLELGEFNVYKNKDFNKVFFKML